MKRSPAADTITTGARADVISGMPRGSISRAEVSPRRLSPGAQSKGVAGATPFQLTDLMAGSTGLEPAASGLTGQCANQAAPRPRAVNLASYGAAVNRLRLERARKRAREPPSDVLEVPRTHNVIPVEDAARPVTGDLHRDSLRDTEVYQIPHRSASEVVAEHPGHAGLRAGGRPGLPEVAPGLAEALTAPAGK
jgi:hypothetical protein